jgi:hypothetical protein
MELTKEHGSLRIRYWFLFLFFLFFFNEGSRRVVQAFSEVGYINFFFSIVAIIFLMRMKDIYVLVSQFKLIYFSLITCVFVNFLLWDNTFILQELYVLISILLPLMFLGMKLEININESIFKFIKVFNIFIYFLLIWGALDYLTGGALQRVLADTIFANYIDRYIYIENNQGMFRYYSILGHPLTTVGYFLMYFILNSTFYRYTKKRSEYNFILIICTLTGSVLCGSKPAILIALIMILFLLPVKKPGSKILFASINLIIMVVVYNLPLFNDNLKQRFIDSFQSGDITTGRNTLLTDWLQSGIDKPGVFGQGIGHSLDVSRALHSAASNFEYPIIMLSYDYGYLFTTLLFFLLIIFSSLRLLKAKKYFGFILVLLLFIFFNTNNTMANFGSDTVSQYCFLVFIVTNMQVVSNNKIKE